MKVNGTVPELRLAIDSELENVKLIGQAIHRIADAAGFEHRASAAVELAVVEAVTNAIKHGYCEQPGHSVEVRARVLSDRLVIEVFDRGVPRPRELFDPERVALPDPCVEGGRGIFLISSLMDGVESRSDGSLNTLRLTKRR